MTDSQAPSSGSADIQGPDNFSQGEVVSLDAADVFPIQIDQAQNMTFVRMLESDYQQSSFLDHRIHRSNNASFTIPLNEFIRVGNNLATPPCSRYIFHISHVGSTLISKILGNRTDILSLREPLLLRWLAELTNSLDQPESWVSTSQYIEYVDVCLAYLSRKFRPENEVIIKATSYTNVLAQHILSQAHLPRALFVYSDLPSFAATILKQSYGLIDIRAQAPARLVRLHKMLGMNAWKLYELSIGEIIAMSWASEMLTLELAAQTHTEQVAWINFDAYLSSDGPAQRQIFDHLALSSHATDMNSMQSDTVMQTNSKDPTKSYSKLDREKDITLVLNREEKEITKCIMWLKNAADCYPTIATLAKKATRVPGPMHQH